jgi:rare lipoprotein A
MRRIMAAWYRVPKDSLAKRRARENEFTAAHNTLPIGTRVLVTNPENGRTVTVRITDRGIHDRRVKLDLCKEAAEELGVIEKGFARVKMQVLNDHGAPGETQMIAADD